MQKIKKPKVHTADGKVFKSRALLLFYNRLKELKEEGFITSFNVPTVESEVKTKYYAKKAEIDGHTFDSIEEAKFYLFIKKEKEEKKIKEFQLQPKFELQPGFEKDGKKIRPIHYISDFLVELSNGEKVVYDVKGQETTDFKLKKKMFNYRYQDLTLKCVQYRATANGWIDMALNKKKKSNQKGKLDYYDAIICHERENGR